MTNVYVFLSFSQNWMDQVVAKFRKETQNLTQEKVQAAKAQSLSCQMDCLKS